MEYLRAATATSEDVDDAFGAGREIAARVKEKVTLGKHSVGVLLRSSADCRAMAGS